MEVREVGLVVRQPCEMPCLWCAEELENLGENANLGSRREERTPTAKLPKHTTQRPQVHGAAKESVSLEEFWRSVISGAKLHALLFHVLLAGEHPVLGVGELSQPEICNYHS